MKIGTTERLNSNHVEQQLDRRIEKVDTSKDMYSSKTVLGFDVFVQGRHLSKLSNAIQETSTVSSATQFVRSEYQPGRTRAVSTGPSLNAPDSVKCLFRSGSGTDFSQRSLEFRTDVTRTY